MAVGLAPAAEVVIAAAGSAFADVGAGGSGWSPAAVAVAAFAGSRLGTWTGTPVFAPWAISAARAAFAGVARVVAWTAVATRVRATGAFLASPWSAMKPPITAPTMMKPIAGRISFLTSARLFSRSWRTWGEVPTYVASSNFSTARLASNQSSPRTASPVLSMLAACTIGYDSGATATAGSA